MNIKNQTPHLEKYKGIEKDFHNAGISEISFHNIDNNRKKQELHNYLLKFFQNTIYSVDVNAPEFLNIVKKISENIINSHKVDISKISSAKISGGVLILQWNNINISFSLTEEWKNNFLDPEKARIQQQAREKEQQLQEIIAKDAFYNGSVVVEYVASTAIAAGSALAITKAWTDIARGKIFYAKSLQIIDENGVKRRIFLKTPYSGTRADFADSVNRILRAEGLEYDPKTKKIFSPAKNMVRAAGDDIKNLTYQKYLQHAQGRKMTEAEFENYKKNLINEQKNILDQLSGNKISHTNAVSRIKRIIGLNIVLFPLFAQEYHNSHTPASVLKALAEEWMFVAGAKVGSKAPVWWIFKAWAVLGGWVLWFLGGSYALEKLEANRHKWLHFQKSNYRHDRSAFLHGTSLFATEITAWANYLWRKFTGNENTWWTDIGINRTHIRIPGINKHIGTIPEITLYQDKITMATNPWEWINAGAHRDVESWNSYVDKYKIQTTKNINEILGKYHRNESIFSDKNFVEKNWGKQKVLYEELQNILSWDQSGRVFENEMTMIILAIMEEINKNSPMPNATINEVIAKNIGAMKIDRTLFVKDREMNLVQRRLEFSAQVESFQFLTTAEKKFIDSFPEKMLNNKNLYQGAYEKSMYEALLNKKDFIPLGDKNITFGNVLAAILDTMVAWKNEKYFVEKIKSWSNAQAEWTSF